MVRTTVVNPRFRYRALRGRARAANIPLDLNYNVFMGFWQEPCSYCGDAIETIGLDRVDNSLGYTKSNVISCCRFCNMFKAGDSREVFLERCRQVSQHRGVL